MSSQKYSKTRWKIDSDRVTVYPYGVFYVFTIIIAILSSGLLFLYFHYQRSATIGNSLPLVFLILLMVVLFWLFGNTYLEFDSSKGRMRKMLFGFLPTRIIPFEKLEGINLVNIAGGSYNYRLFKKDARYGKGIIVSSGYTKNNDPNAIAFVEEVVPIIHGYLSQYTTPADYVAERITSYKFFTEEAGVYNVKNRKIGALLFSLLCFAGGVYFMRLDTYDGTIPQIIIVAVMILLGFVFIYAAFTKISFDPVAQTVSRTGPVSYWNREYPMSAFTGIQTLRRSVNFVYTSTEVKMYFDMPDKKGYQQMLTVATLRRSSDIDRFVKEVYQIMGI
ncbi:hypothetical protein [Mucilaginibacter sp. KACC 22063]|uniref:hypothetical protein n=1 Tax=Mucilaginibacter sp. KACC 22063 TaxID=3025666 RepID=UPI002367247A|nr:hypothetical protein [Mucilaginibacter sp. KACC 22063]WDF55952.1 hypothetical protein PQ461_02625 [Mucilaginibacter sp. KACC 22063]